MTIDLLNPAHSLLLSLAFLFWGWLNGYVSEKEEKGEPTLWEFPTIILISVNIGAVLASLIHLIIKLL